MGYIISIQGGGTRAPQKPEEKKMNATMTRGQEIAENILKQLGGNMFLAMTGAKNLAYSDNGISMKIGRNAKKVTHVQITLNDLDLYDVEYFSIRGTNYKTTAKSESIYNDMLVSDFEKNTGMYTSL